MLAEKKTMFNLLLKILYNIFAGFAFMLHTM